MSVLSQTGLWRNTPPSHRLDGAHSGFAAQYIFPSGRQALSQGLLIAGLSRPKRVACPEWSSQCVLSAISRFATPIPMAEVVRHDLPVDAIVLYEQWGWPIPDPVWEQLRERFSQVPLIWDRVDSADYLCRTESPSPAVVADITSLSKLLGVIGGGILRYQGHYVAFEPGPASALNRHVLQAGDTVVNSSESKAYFQDQARAVHPGVLNWIAQNSLERALEEESAARQRNLRLLMSSEPAAGWPPWMRKAVERGAAAGIAPLLRNAGNERLKEAVSFLQSQHNIATTIYHFNWSGNPMSPNYEPCLAFPVHGEIQDPQAALSSLANLISTYRTLKTG